MIIWIKQVLEKRMNILFSRISPKYRFSKVRYRVALKQLITNAAVAVAL